MTQRVRSAELLAWATLITGLLGGCGSSNVELVGTWEPVRWGVFPASSELDPHDAPITFHDDGTWTGRDGCHEVSGTYSLDGEKITTPAVAGTGTGCPNGDIPYEELMSVVVEVHRRGDTLTFEGVDGEFVLELTAVS